MPHLDSLRTIILLLLLALGLGWLGALSRWVGETILASGVGRIVESQADGWVPGMAIRGPLGPSV